MLLRYRLAVVLTAASAVLVPVFSAQTPAARSGIREPAFSPDGRRLAVSWLDELWTMTPDGREERKIVTENGGWLSERDPAWSPDGRSIAFSAGSSGEFDIYVVSVAGPEGPRQARRVTSLAGDERWPSWTRDGRLLFSHRPLDERWQIYATAADGSIATLADLEGKRLGIAGGPLDKSWLLIQALAKERDGVDLAAISEVVYGAPPLLT